MAAIYFHIPFCKTRCAYCDFYSSTLSEIKDGFITALCSEIDERSNYLNGEQIQTIYFGGGTPSLLSPADFQPIFCTLEAHFNLDNCKEITLEANPDDLSPIYLEALSSLPFNRLSIGIQTLNDKMLRLINRRHTAKQALNSVKEARKAGFKNISIDLMYGLPKETLDNFKFDIEQVLMLDVPHISAYHLTYEEGTPLFRWLQEGRINETDEELSLLFFNELTTQLRKAGYEHYEISNFCKPNQYSQHNRSYWNGTHYLGCGPSAHSYNGNSRSWNVSNIYAYIEGIKNGKLNYEIEKLDIATRYNDLIITSLRTKWGTSIQQVEDEFGEVFMNHLLQQTENFLRTEDLSINNAHLVLTKKGLLISNRIMSELLWVDP